MLLLLLLLFLHLRVIFAVAHQVHQFRLLHHIHRVLERNIRIVRHWLVQHLVVHAGIRRLPRWSRRWRSFCSNRAILRAVFASHRCRCVFNIIEVVVHPHHRLLLVHAMSAAIRHSVHHSEIHFGGVADHFDWWLRNYIAVTARSTPNVGGWRLPIDVVLLTRVCVLMTVNIRKSRRQIFTSKLFVFFLWSTLCNVIDAVAGNLRRTRRYFPLTTRCFAILLLRRL